MSSISEAPSCTGAGLGSGTLRSPNRLLLTECDGVGSAEAGVGSLGGGIVLDLLEWSCGDVSRFSLSDEKDAAGDGDMEAGPYDLLVFIERVEAFARDTGSL